MHKFLAIYVNFLLVFDGLAPYFLVSRWGTVLICDYYLLYKLTTERYVCILLLFSCKVCVRICLFISGIFSVISSLTSHFFLICFIYLFSSISLFEYILSSTMCFIWISFWKGSPGEQLEAVEQIDGPSKCANGGGLSDLEQILKQKTFSRQVFVHFVITLKN